MGAWRLKEECQQRNARLREQLVYHEAKTREPLEAVFEEGESGVTVHLKGEDLHGNKNRAYWPEDARKSLKAVFAPEVVASSEVFTKRKTVVRIVGEHLEIPEYEGMSILCFVHMASSPSLLTRSGYSSYF